MNNLEQQLLSLSDKLRKASTLEEEQSVNRAVRLLHRNAAALDVSDPAQYVLKRFYDYLDTTSHNAVHHRTKWLQLEQAEIERGLLDVLATVRHHQKAVSELSTPQVDLESLRLRIDQLDSSPAAHHLRDVLNYVQWKTQQTLELAVNREAIQGQERRAPSREVLRPEIEPPTMEMW
ncbi:hypothetical protein [Nocardia brasiliensis]|uniref:hypothetical protein n=1 Tax=Nocardia brasiliensis TaxID=37326 RepID=UPI0024576049|nr:hypothetical protein [Nocardia brasiliensis]